MTNLTKMYKRRNKYTVLGILSILFTPLPGLGLGCFIQAKCIDNDIKEEALRIEAEAKV